MNTRTAEVAGLLRSHRLAIGNLRELDEFARTTQAVPAALRLMVPENEAERETFLDETDRLMHNFVGSVYSLHEHVRKSSVDGEVRKLSLAHLTSEPMSALLHIRKYSTHERLPVYLASLSFSLTNGKTTGMDFCPTLLRDPLLNTNPGSKARRYLTTFPEDPPIVAIMDDAKPQLEASLEAWNTA